MQERLAILGYNAGKVDGVLGPQTLAAMEKYKRDKGLSSTASVEDIRQLVSMDAALKLLDKMQDLYEESAAPKLLWFNKNGHFEKSDKMGKGGVP